MQSTTDSLDFVTMEGLLAYGEPFVRQPAIETIPLHAVSPKQFDWDLFARMHGTELRNGPL